MERTEKPNGVVGDDSLFDELQSNRDRCFLNDIFAVDNERVATIRDFRYVPYIAREANIELIR